MVDDAWRDEFRPRVARAGIRPHIRVPWTAEALRDGRDPALKVAIERLRSDGSWVGDEPAA